MKANEDYFQLTQQGHLHVLSNRLKLDWKELIVLPLIVLVPMGLWVDWFIGVILALVIGIAYAVYRLKASHHYSEIQIDEHSGKMTRYVMKNNTIVGEELIAETYDASNISWKGIKNNTHFLLMYVTETNHELMMLKTTRDQQIVDEYLKNEINISNQ